MNLFLYLFYQASKTLVKLVLGVFYAKTVIVNKENLKYQNPGIVVSNHPNALLDPLHVASRTRKIQFFLANITMFHHPISNWFFSTFYCIPIERPKDVGNRTVQNKESFAKCDEFLSGGGSLYIAPQGAMELERRITKLKTGTARIALSAENNNNFNLGMTVLPVGLNYSEPNDFRSTLVINVGEPMLVKDYKAAYEQDQFGAVRQMTADLHKRLSALVIDTADDEEDDLLRKIEEIQATEKPLSLDATLLRSQKTLRELQHLRAEEPKAYQKLANNLNNYFGELTNIKSTDEGLVKNNVAPTFFESLIKLLGGVLVFPVFLYGWINNYLAAFLPAWIARKMNLFKGYTATVKTLSSLFVFPLIYGIQIFLVQHFGGVGWITVVYALSLYPAGLFAWWCKENWKKHVEARRFKKYAQQNPKKQTALKEQRVSILENLVNLGKQTDVRS